MSVRRDMRIENGELFAADVGAEFAEAGLDVFVAAVDAFGVEDVRLALCREGGDEEGDAGADVGACYASAM